MPGMRDIKRRIRSIESTQKITKAMKMVAAAKLRKSQNKVVSARPYSAKLQEVLGRLVHGSEDYSHPLLDSRETSRVGYVVITADRGLCGGYNANLIRLTESLIRENDKESVIIAVGKKGRDYFRRRGYTLLREYLDLGDDPNYIQARELARELAQIYISGEVQELNLVYTKFYSAIRQQPLTERLLPVTKVEKKENSAEVDYIYEPSAKEVLHTLLPRYLETLIYKALLEAKASEHGARMTAMDAASDNAGEMIQKLTLSFNRARQAAITREITEIVGGAAALE
ncbi:ATP synthase F1 subunit gamma [Zhaonella formicivorans]|uniref:ATP synthase F1 subunit gamma n=1 Tax=Zhaonella formicivorans TaxID=2528593 RepID=UPI0010EF55F6|nr:ATP synthase F1 subunit gamma [Zhaonella formicivorans]